MSSAARRVRVSAVIACLSSWAAGCTGKIDDVTGGAGGNTGSAEAGGSGAGSGRAPATADERGAGGRSGGDVMAGGSGGPVGGQGGPAPAIPAACKTASVKPGPAPLRRLTRLEYNNTVRDLLGDTTGPANAFPPEDRAFGFNNNADALTVTDVLTEQLLLSAESLSSRAVLDPGKLSTCPTATAGDEMCARQFIDNFGRRAFRRPLDAGESMRFSQLYSSGRGAGDHANGIRLVVQAMLLSPHFLYRVEFGTPGTGPAVKLTSWEVASRLSYLLWATMPDEPLLMAAQMGQLATPAQVESHARRMLADVRARAVVADFHAQWLSLDLIAQLDKDPKVFRGWTEAMRPAMRGETERFLDHVVWEGAGDWATMLKAPFTFMNAAVAPLYGVTTPMGAGYQRVDVDATRRAGFLTHPGLLSVHAKLNQTSPVQRGKFVQEQLFCNDLPPPPPNVEAMLPEPNLTATTRERFSMHAAVPACSTCHQLLDPIGLGFENYDGIGRWRDVENGKTIDASGSIRGSDIDGPFTGAVAMANRLATSNVVRSCLVKQWFRFAHGRSDTPEDGCTLATLAERFVAGRSNVRELLVALTQTDAFLYRPAGTR